MKKYRIFFVADLIWSTTFLILAARANRQSATGLEALESLGDFIMYALLCIAGVIAFIIGMIIWLIRCKFHKR